MKPLGVALLRVRHRGKAFLTEFYIVEHCAATLIGLPSFQKLDVLRRVDVLRINRRSVNVIDEFGDVFDGFGLLPWRTLYCCGPICSTSYSCASSRSLPLSLQPKLKQKLDSMVAAGVLVKQNDPNDWVNSLLAVERKDGSLQLCLDPKDLNKAIKRAHYAIPTVDDIVAQLHGKSVFTIRHEGCFLANKAR